MHSIESHSPFATWQFYAKRTKMSGLSITESQIFPWLFKAERKPMRLICFKTIFKTCCHVLRPLCSWILLSEICGFLFFKKIKERNEYLTWHTILFWEILINTLISKSWQLLHTILGFHVQDRVILVIWIAYILHSLLIAVLCMPIWSLECAKEWEVNVYA